MFTVQKADLDKLLHELRHMDTAAICDADKIVRSQDNTTSYKGIKLLQSTMRPVNSQNAKQVMVGPAFTVQCTQRNDFLAVLRGLMEAKKGDILMVDTCNSDRAVAGELFCLQALQKGVGGLVVDGPVRDTVFVEELEVSCYSTSITPYSGTTQSPGTTNVSITCGGVTVDPGDVVVGDKDGIVVADAHTFETLLPHANAIYEAEQKIKDRLLMGESLATLTNCVEHIQARLAGQDSSLEFKV